jgi:hypothetical protein
MKMRAKMKKFIVFCVTGLLILAAGCSSVAPTPTVAPTQAPTTAPATTQPAASATPSAEATSTQEVTDAPTATPAVIEPLSQLDLQLVVEGEYYQLQTDVGPLLETLGEDFEVDDVKGRLSGETEKKYVYKDAIEITTFSNDYDVMYIVDFTSDMFDTARSIHVGSTADEIKAAYGDGYYEEGGAMIYTFNGKKADDQSSSITFKLKDGVVTSVILYNANEIQE